MANENIQYCKHCGGTNIRYGIETNEMSVEKLFKPQGQVGFGPLNVELSAGSLSSTDAVKYNFESNQCQTCLNTSVINTTIDTRPLEICPSGNKPIVVIPHLLHAALLIHNYGIQEIYDLIVRVKIRLSQIHSKWEQSGVNPCDHDKLGYKMTLPLNDDFKLDCWVIVDQINSQLAYRLVFGGRNVQCR